MIDFGFVVASPFGTMVFFELFGVVVDSCCDGGAYENED